MPDFPPIGSTVTYVNTLHPYECEVVAHKITIYENEELYECEIRLQGSENMDLSLADLRW